MSSIYQDLSLFISKIARVFKRTPKAQTTRVGIHTRVKHYFFPRARLTYWLADEEVIVYVRDFKQKDKFKLIYRELETGRDVMVNSANPINYRLEELKAGDPIEAKVVQQDQRY